MKKALLFLLALLFSLLGCANELNGPCVGPAPGVCKSPELEKDGCPKGAVKICDRFDCTCGTRADVERIMRGY